MSMNCLLPDFCIGVTVWGPHPCGGYYMIEAWCYGPHGRIGYWMDAESANLLGPFGPEHLVREMSTSVASLDTEVEALKDEAHQLRELVLSLGMNHDQYARLCAIPSYALREIKSQYTKILSGETDG